MPPPRTTDAVVAARGRSRVAGATDLTALSAAEREALLTSLINTLAVVQSGQLATPRPWLRRRQWRCRRRRRCRRLLCDAAARARAAPAPPPPLPGLLCQQHALRCPPNGGAAPAAPLPPPPTPPPMAASPPPPMPARAAPPQGGRRGAYYVNGMDTMGVDDYRRALQRKFDSTQGR